MATPTLGLLNHNLLTAADVSTGWTLLTTAETDLKKEGASSMSGIFRATLATGYYTNGTAVSAVGKTVRVWMNTTNVPYMQTEALGGYQFLIYDGTTTEYKVAVGSDTYDGGWKNFVIDAGLYTTLTLANAIRWGWRCNHVVSAKNVINMWVDAIRYLDGYYATGGTSGDKIRLSGIALIDKGSPTLNGYGVLTLVDGVYFSTGKIVIGNVATSTYFEMDGDVLVFTDQDVAAGLYQLTGEGSGCNIVIKNSVIKSVGTSANTRFLLDMDETNLASMSLTASVIDRASTCSFKAGQTITGNTFNNCGQINTGGAVISDCVISNSFASSAVVATSPANAALVSDTAFTSAGTGHAIEIGDVGGAANMTLTGNTYTGYDSDTSSVHTGVNITGNEAVYINIAGGSMTLTISGGTTPSVASAGCSVTVSTSSRTIKVAVTKVSGVVTGANVFLAAAAGGPFPSGADPDDIVTISSSGTTATVNHTEHGMATNDQINIDGIANKIGDNNGVHTITWLNANSYTYMTDDTGPTDYTGTIKVTFVFLKGEATAGTGLNEISMSRSIPSSQPVAGWARKSTEAPYFKEGAISGTVSSTGDTTFSPVLISDD